MKTTTQVPPTGMAVFKLLGADEASKILPGTVMFLPAQISIPKGAFTDPELLDGAFNHPVVIISCPKPTQHNSHVEFVIGLKVNTGTLAAQRFGYLRVATESKPFAKDTLKLRNGKGMKRDFCYVNVKQSYTIELKALAQYGFREEVDAYRLTSQATTKLINAVRLKEKGNQKMKRKTQKELVQN
ncbi:hypothetical protein N431DRAFT_499419 [Stipitochalara longipes BDJ]|nr:hypothetical protein N431DRAFT_499419 [Stipitochalara longipes BDJ]